MKCLDLNHLFLKDDLLNPEDFFLNPEDCEGLLEPCFDCFFCLPDFGLQRFVQRLFASFAYPSVAPRVA